MNRTFLGLTLSGIVAVALGAGCAESNSSAKTTNGSGTETGKGGSGAGGGTTTTTGGGGATGTGGGGTTTSTSSTGTGGGGQVGTPGDHVLISEIGVAPAGGEFIEVYNPTNAEVDLTDYYRSDNSVYWTFAAGQAWNPPTDNEGTDFLARFPKGTKLPAGGVVVIATDPTYKDTFGACPDFTLKGAFDGCQTLAMNAPADGAIGTVAGLSNSREMVVLFKWDGDTSHNLEDVDYVTWGADFEDATRVDKSGQGSYVADTARASQKAAAAPKATESIERCKLDSGEKLSGGNGITGHDETSEDLAASFSVQAAPSPGQKNGCL